MITWRLKLQVGCLAPPPVWYLIGTFYLKIGVMSFFWDYVTLQLFLLRNKFPNYVNKYISSSYWNAFAVNDVSLKILRNKSVLWYSRKIESFLSSITSISSTISSTKRGEYLPCSVTSLLKSNSSPVDFTNFSTCNWKTLIVGRSFRLNTNEGCKQNDERILSRKSFIKNSFAWLMCCGQYTRF